MRGEVLRRRGTLEMSWATGEEFLEGVQDRDGVASFFYAMPDGFELPPAFKPCAVLSLRLRFLDRGMDFHVHAQVIGHKREGHRRGVWLEFLPYERARQELVLACAEGESIPYRRRWSPRIEVGLVARVEVEDGRVLRAVTTNISRGGVHLSIDEEFLVDQPLALELSLDGFRPLRISGRVVYLLAEGPQRGVGVEFLFECAAQRAEVAGVVARLVGSC